MLINRKWNIGLDIQANTICAVVTLPSKKGWIWQKWWFKQSPEKFVTNQGLPLQKIITPILHQWRKELPKRFSLRIALPVQCILQKSLAIPDIELTYQESYEYIKNSISKLFPLSSNELTFDYRKEQTHWKITAIRQSDLQQWITCIEQAGWQIDIIDIVPAILRQSAQLCQLPVEHTLAYYLGNAWIVISALQQPMEYYLIESDNKGDDFKSIISTINTHYFSKYHQQANGISFSGLLPKADSKLLSWTPLTCFQQLPSPLPVSPQCFMLACGLATRRQDRE